MGKKNEKIIFIFLFFPIYNPSRALINRAGRKPVRAGRSALRNRLSWNTGSGLVDAFRLLEGGAALEGHMPMRQSPRGAAIVQTGIHSLILHCAE